MPERQIDLNADIGEFPERVADGSDRELMRYISSANIACGGHAGDEWSMKQTLEAAQELGVAVGAHPGYPDRANFGRVAVSMTIEELEATIREQIETLADIANELGMALAHVKPHGALYHEARKPEIAMAIGRAIIAASPELIVVGQAGATALDIWRDMGLRCVGEAFADRTYESDGSLRSRSLSGALLDDPNKAAQQALDIVLRHSVHAGPESVAQLSAQTLCIHSDPPGAAAIAREVSRQLKGNGIVVRALSRAG